MFYSLISGGDENITFFKGKYPFSGDALNWFEEAWDSELTKAALIRPEVWEPRHRVHFPKLSTSLQNELIRESFAFKYVNAVTFLTKGFTDDLLAGLRAIDVAKALRFLTWFHIITDHPISHALLTNGVVFTESGEWADFVALADRDFSGGRTDSNDLLSLPLRLLVHPTAEVLQTVAAAGLEPLPLELVQRLESFTIEELREFRAKLTHAALRHEECIKKISHVAKTAQNAVQISAIGWGLTALFAGDPTLTTAIKAAITLAGGKLAIKSLTSRLQQWRTSYLLTLISKTT